MVPHALLIGLYDGPLVDRLVGLPERMSHSRQRRRPKKIAGAGKLAGHDLNSHFARHLARCVASHAVCDNEKPPLGIGVGVKAVFVTCSNAPDVGAGGDGKLHVDGVVLARGNL